MKKLLVLASFVALTMSACNNGAKEVAVAQSEVESVVSSDLAYVNVDMVLAQCELFKTEGAALQTKTEKAQKGWAQKEQNLQAEAVKLQEKYQKGLITSANAQQQQKSIEQRVANYQASAQKEAKAIEEENYVFTNRAQDLLHRAIEQINSDKKYKMIVNASALIDADSTLDITTKVLESVNALYASEKEETK